MILIIFFHMEKRKNFPKKRLKYGEEKVKYGMRLENGREKREVLESLEVVLVCGVYGLWGLLECLKKRHGIILWKMRGKCGVWSIVSGGDGGPLFCVQHCTLYAFTKVTLYILFCCYLIYKSTLKDVYHYTRSCIWSLNSGPTPPDSRFLLLGLLA